MHDSTQNAPLPLVGGRSFNLVLQLALATIIFCLFNPLIPVFPSDIPLDPAWVIGLNQAVSQNLIFGQDLIFTFGPYAAIYTKAYHPATNHLEIIGSLYLATLYIAALLLVLRNAKIMSLIAMGAVLLGFTTHLDPLFYSYPLLVGIYCWQLITPNDFKKPWHRHWELITIPLLFSGFGLYPLIKGPHFVLLLPIALLSAGLFLAKRKYFEALLIPCSIGISMVCFWLLADQQPVSLLSYFGNLIELIGGFSQAMSTPGNTWEILGYLIASSAILIYVLANGRLRYETLYLCILFGLFLFAAFKAGFVRHDGHALMASQSLIIAAILVTIIFPVRSAFLLLICVCAVFVYIESQYKPNLLLHFFERARLTIQSPPQGLQLRLFHPKTIDDQFNQSLKMLASKRPLPILPGTTDIYPFDQSYLIASGNAWLPRPIFQSYHAYTKKLAQINAQFLAQSTSPNHLFFRVETIDQRLPSGDDGASWPFLLTMYRPNGFAGPYLILQKQEVTPSPAMHLISKSQARMGDWVSISPANAKVFASMDFEKSWRGKLKSAFYKSSTLLIHLRLKNNTIKQFRIIPDAAQTTFLLSPLIEDAHAFSKLYGNIDLLKMDTVQAFSISVDGNPKDWQPNYHFKLQTLE